MQVSLTKDDSFEILISDVPAEKAAQLHSDVTALVFGFKENYVAEPFSDDRLESFLVGMGRQLGDRISAIKAIRHLTGLGLKEAKDFVDAVVTRNSLFGYSPAHPANASVVTGGFRP